MKSGRGLTYLLIGRKRKLSIFTKSQLQVDATIKPPTIIPAKKIIPLLPLFKILFTNSILFIATFTLN